MPWWPLSTEPTTLCYVPACCQALPTMPTVSPRSITPLNLTKEQLSEAVGVGFTLCHALAV